MDKTFWETLIGQGGLGIVAAVALWLLNKVWELRMSDKEEELRRLRNDREVMQNLLQENAEALTAFKGTLERFCQTFERLNLALVEFFAEFERKKSRVSEISREVTHEH